MTASAIITGLRAKDLEAEARARGPLGDALTKGRDLFEPGDEGTARGLTAADIMAQATSVPRRPRPFEVRREGNGWAIVGRSPCGCVVGAVYARTLQAAVWRYRFARRERWLLTEAQQ